MLVFLNVEDTAAQGTFWKFVGVISTLQESTYYWKSYYVSTL